MSTEAFLPRALSRRDFARVVGAASAGAAFYGCGGTDATTADGMPLDGPYDVTLQDGVMVAIAHRPLSSSRSGSRRIAPTPTSRPS